MKYMEKIVEKKNGFVFQCIVLGLSYAMEDIHNKLIKGQRRARTSKLNVISNYINTIT